MRLRIYSRQHLVSFVILFIFTLLLITAVGCDPETDVISDIVEDEINDTDPDDVEEADPEEPDLPEPEEPAEEITGTPPTYYWPWLSHAILELSSGELIAGPDIIMSDPGFMAEFTEEYSYEGRLFWLVEESNVFTLDWIHLSFNVDFFDDSDFARELNFEFRMDDFEPTEEVQGIDPAEEAIWLMDYEADYLQIVDGFAVEINSIILGKGQESSIGVDLVDYVALEIVMYVEDKNQ